MPIRVLDPTQPPEVMAVTPATRQAVTEPVTLLLLSNGKTNADKLMRLVIDQLAVQLKIDHVIEATKESSTTNAPEALLDRLAEECGLALVAIGD